MSKRKPHSMRNRLARSHRLDVPHHHVVVVNMGPSGTQGLIASGWIANPSGVSMTEEQAARVFDAVGAWPVQRAA